MRTETFRTVILKPYILAEGIVPEIALYGSLRSYNEDKGIVLSHLDKGRQRANLTNYGLDYICPHTGLYLVRVVLETKGNKRRCIVACNVQPAQVRALSSCSKIKEALGLQSYYKFGNAPERRGNLEAVVFDPTTKFWIARRQVISTLLPEGSRGTHLKK